MLVILLHFSSVNPLYQQDFWKFLENNGAGSSNGISRYTKKLLQNGLFPLCSSFILLRLIFLSIRHDIPPFTAYSVLPLHMPWLKRSPCPCHNIYILLNVRRK